MLKPFRQLLGIFSPTERLHALIVLAAMFGMGVMQMLGVGVIMPFVALLSDPSTIHSNAFLSWLYTTLGFASTTGFLIFVGCVLLVVLVGSNVFTAATIWVMAHFSWNVQRRVSVRLLDGYLHQSYEFFLNRNSADTGKNILIESAQFANNVLMPVLKSMAFAITALMIIGFLFWLQPWIALAVAVLFGGAYLLIYMTIRKLLHRIGKRRMNANEDRFRAVGEAFGSIKEVKVLNQERHFLSRYEPAARTFSRVQSRNVVLGLIPKYAIEGLAYSLIMAAMLFLLASGHNLVKALPIASAFVLAGYRLLPALQNIYQGFTKWRFNQSVLDMLERDLAANPAGKSNAGDGAAERMPFEKAIVINHLTYCYPNTESPSLDDISLTIPKNSFVAFTGTTGAGKTTLVDVMLGLLEPAAGDIRIDETPITQNNCKAWQANIGYVPQEIYLTDATIASNIAYGLSGKDLDQTAVERAAKIANIHDFIVNKLPDGYDTVVGERGVRLSGGQRQRIGIARALYHDPSVIVLDEATSALDNETERRIVNELDAMRGGRTLIVIAHRLTTVQKCHAVFMLEEGKVVAHGSYDDLIHDSEEFSHLAHARPKSATQG